MVDLVAPASAAVMGAIALAEVRYDEFLPFVWPLLALMTVLNAVFVVWRRSPSEGASPRRRAVTGPCARA